EPEEAPLRGDAGPRQDRDEQRASLDMAADLVLEEFARHQAVPVEPDVYPGGVERVSQRGSGGMIVTGVAQEDRARVHRRRVERDRHWLERALFRHALLPAAMQLVDERHRVGVVKELGSG